MWLSENFNLREFTRSQIAEREGRRIYADPEVLERLERLCRLALQPIRTMLGRPITITSGYRPPWLNQRVGGSPASAHQAGRAADFVVAGMTAFEASSAIARLGHWIEIDQHILEFNRWTHIAIAAADRPPRREALTAYHDGVRTVYAPGIIQIEARRPGL